MYYVLATIRLLILGAMAFVLGALIGSVTGNADTRSLPPPAPQVIELIAILQNPQDPTLVDFLLIACDKPLVVTFPQSQLTPENNEKNSQIIVDRATEVCNNVSK